MCATDLARDFGRVVGQVMSDVGIPDTPKGRKVAALTMLSVAATLIEEPDFSRFMSFFEAVLTRNPTRKQEIYAQVLGADVVQEQHTHFVVDFEGNPSE
jgi:hypothetical protein